MAVRCDNNGVAMAAVSAGWGGAGFFFFIFIEISKCKATLAAEIERYRTRLYCPGPRSGTLLQAETMITSVWSSERRRKWKVERPLVGKSCYLCGCWRCNLSWCGCWRSLIQLQVDSHQQQEANVEPYKAHSLSIGGGRKCWKMLQPSSCPSFTDTNASSSSCFTNTQLQCFTLASSGFCATENLKKCLAGFERRASASAASGRATAMSGVPSVACYGRLRLPTW